MVVTIEDIPFGVSEALMVDVEGARRDRLLAVDGLWRSCVAGERLKMLFAR